MARISHLERRGKSGTYYARIYIPKDLISHFGADNKKVSLRTKEEAKAKELLFIELQRWNDRFQDIRARREVSAEDMAQATWEHYQSRLERDDAVRRAMPSPSDLQREEEAVWAKIDNGEIGAHDFIGMVNAHADLELMRSRRHDERNLRIQRLNALRRHLNTGETWLVDEAAQKYAADHHLHLKPGTADHVELCLHLIRAEIEALERTLERDGGDYAGTPKDPIVRPAGGSARQVATSGETIMDLFSRYASENPKGITADTLNQARRDVQMFADFAGRRIHVEQITKKVVRDWKALLMLFPVKATEAKVFQGLGMEAIVKKNEKIGRPTLTPRTVNRYLASLGAFCNWLVSHGYLERNPTEGMSLAKDKTKKVFPFTVDEMNALFRSPLFTGCAGADEWRDMAKPGEVLIRDHRYWVPLIMLFSGARPGEIAQLAVNDVRMQDGQWIMHITEEGDGDKQVKTAGSMRVIPLHPDLLRLGFTDYHASIAKNGGVPLFPDAKRNKRGQMIADFSRAFGRYLTKIGIKSGRGLSLYSFRHGATDAFRRAGYLDEDFGFLLGHTKSTTTGRYGILPPGVLAKRVELINAIAYEGLELSHLAPSSGQGNG